MRSNRAGNDGGNLGLCLRQERDADAFHQAPPPFTASRPAITQACAVTESAASDVRNMAILMIVSASRPEPPRRRRRRSLPGAAPDLGTPVGTR